MTVTRFASIPELLAELKAGHAVLLANGTGREAVGDLVCAAEWVTPRLVSFFSREGQGTTGLALATEKCDALRLSVRPEEFEPGGGRETVTFDARKYVRTGLSATDRATTILTAIADDAKPSDLKRPGHVHALRAVPGGVLARVGMAEAAVDLARLAGLKPAAVLCPVMARNGELAHLPKLRVLAAKRRLKLGTVPDLVAHWVRNEVLVRRVASALTQNEHGAFRLLSYYSLVDRQAHYVLCKGEVGDRAGRSVHLLERPVLVRVHSECLTGDVFHSRRCDCGEQLAAALRMIEAQGEGALVYLRQEGRGIGLLNKLRAYKLQEQGRDTVEANEELGFPADRRDYGTAWQILRDLGITKIRLMTNNPAKVYGLEAYGLEICERVPLPVSPNKANLRYLETKRIKLGHHINC
jgi:3,4-dihydroxy 2-butanone 4-phosphate synthase/GTP cyclohydrolase II